MLVPALTTLSSCCSTPVSVVSPSSVAPWAVEVPIVVKPVLAAVISACTLLLMLVWSDATEIVTFVAGLLTR